MAVEGNNPGVGMSFPTEQPAPAIRVMTRCQCSSAAGWKVISLPVRSGALTEIIVEG